MTANVLLFDRRPPSENPWTSQLWIYDLRTNQNLTLKTRALARADLDDFAASYNPASQRRWPGGWLAGPPAFGEGAARGLGRGSAGLG